MSRHVTSRHVTSRCVTSRHITSSQVKSSQVKSSQVKSSQVKSCHVMSRHVTSRSITTFPFHLFQVRREIHEFGRERQSYRQDLRRRDQNQNHDKLCHRKKVGEWNGT
jgi:hypothetical protein